jgi:hypothetical protein
MLEVVGRREGIGMTESVAALREYLWPPTVG